MSGHGQTPGHSPESSSRPDNEAPAQTANFDNFYTPQNRSFYDHAPYNPLGKEPREIRLVALSLDRRGQDHLELRLYDNVPLEQAGDFYALSYAAGDHRQTEAIHITIGDSGKRVSFNAFSNLAKALRAVRDFDGSAGPLSTGRTPMLRFWVDQICINQSDPDERADQVAHMREIYQSASTTIAYLGEDPDEGKAIKYLKRVALYADLVALPPDRRDDALKRASRWMVDHITSLDSDHTDNWKALYTMLGQPWWERGWICQEAVVSRSPVVMYGSLKLDFNSLAAGVQVFTEARTRLLIFELSSEEFRKSHGCDYLANLKSGDPSHAAFIVGWWINWHFTRRDDQPYLEMKSLLQYARKCKTGDLRDRVYAFIGLADPIYGIVPNYKKTVAEVFTDAAAHILKKEQSPDVILEALDNIPQWTPRLPTWVADWSCPRRLRRNPFGTKSVSASAVYEGPITFLFPDAGKDGSSYGRILRIKALRLGTLSSPDRFICVESGQEDEAAHITSSQWGIKMIQDLMVADSSDLYTRGDLIDAMLPDCTLLNQIRNLFGTKIGLDQQWPLFTSPNGFMGRASPGTRHDDDLFLALGASIPIILRKVEGQDCYSLVGEAHMYDMMDGKAIKLMEEGKLHVEEVDII